MIGEGTLLRLEALLEGRVLPRFLQLCQEVGQELRSGRVDFPGAFRLIRSPIHGMTHWVRVGCLGLGIAEAAWGGDDRKDDEESLLLAAFFHDAARVNEHLDSGHGRRGAALLEACAEPLAWPSRIAGPAADAIRRHQGQGGEIRHGAGRVAAALANADRLDRVRFGDVPVDRLMHLDGAWQDLLEPACRLVDRVDEARVRRAGLLAALAPARE